MILPVAEASNEVTLIAAGIAFAASVLAGILGWHAQRSASGLQHAAAQLETASSKQVAAQDRFGPWQLKKREMYTELLRSAYALRETRPEDADRAERQSFQFECERAMLYAYEYVLPELGRFHDNPELVRSDADVRNLVLLLRRDILFADNANRTKDIGWDPAKMDERFRQETPRIGGAGEG